LCRRRRKEERVQPSQASRLLAGGGNQLGKGEKRRMCFQDENQLYNLYFKLTLDCLKLVSNSAMFKHFPEMVSNMYDV